MNKAPLVSLLLAGAVLAQASDFEDRYHEAYALEVIDGKPAEAARRYLALLREKELPDRLRAQCEFRFAVTCVVLGRPDEARARLAAIAADPKTPAALKPQIEEYRKSLRDAAPGRELDRRLQELKFELGKKIAVYSHDSPKVKEIVRELQIIGRPAVPFLKGLLEHTDAALRDQAFFVLCTMDVPELWRLWRPEFRVSVDAFRDYLKRGDGRLRAFAYRLLEFDDEVFARKAPSFANYAEAGDVPEAFFQRLAGLRPETAAGLQTGYDPTEAVRKRLLAWMRSDKKVATYAAAVYRRRAGREPAWATPEAVRLAVAHAPARPGTFMQRRLKLMARHLPPGDLFAILESATPEQVRGGWAYALAAGLDNRAFDAARYEKLLRGWWPIVREEKVLDQNFVYRLRALRRAGGGEEWIASLFREADARHVGTLARVLQYEGTRTAKLLRAAWARPEARAPIAETVADGIEDFDDPEIARAVAGFLVDLVQDRSGDAARELAQRFPPLARELDPKEARRLARGIAEADPYALLALFPHEGAPLRDAGSYYGEVLPALASRVGELPSNLRHAVASAALRVLAAYPDLPDDARTAYRDLVLAELGQLELNVNSLQRFPELFPPILWVPQIAGRWWSNERFAPWLRGEAARRVVEKFQERPEDINENVLAFIWVRDEARTGTLAKLLRGADARLADLLIRTGGVTTELPEGELLAAVERLTPDASLADAALLKLVDAAPASRTLLPACRRLLRSDDMSVVRDAATIAGNLGTKELAPDLARLLESLDVGVRHRAENAINQIRALEVKRRELRRALGLKKEPSEEK